MESEKSLKEELVSMRADHYIDGQTQPDEDLFGPLAGAIAGQLVEQRIGFGRHEQLSLNLMKRVRHSVQAHRKFVTVRHERSAYEPIAPGVFMRALRLECALRVDLMRLDPHTQVYWPDAVHAQEIFVMEGSVSDGASFLLPRHELAVRNNRETDLKAGTEGATLYLRQVIDPLLLVGNEALWWSDCDTIDAKAWNLAADGVEVRVLRGHDNVVSMLVRIAAGATVPQHAHKLDEDCLMLSGEFFSGDILLRQGDYQLVPQDIDHCDSMSDTGALLYIHGVMPEID